MDQQHDDEKTAAVNPGAEDPLNRPAVMSKPSSAEIAQLKEKYSGEDLVLLRAGNNHCVVRMPRPSEWQKFRKTMTRQDQRHRAFEFLFRDCVVHPGAEGVEHGLKKMPGLAETFGTQLAEAAGMADEDQLEKKLL